jgi:hypothetical protein
MSSTQLSSSSKPAAKPKLTEAEAKAETEMINILFTIKCHKYESKNDKLIDATQAKNCRDRFKERINQLREEECFKGWSLEALLDHMQSQTALKEGWDRLLEDEEWLMEDEIFLFLMEDMKTEASDDEWVDVKGL